MCNIHITQFIFHLPVHWISQIAMVFSFLDVRVFFFLARMQTCFLSSNLLAFQRREVWGVSIVGIVNIFLKDILEEAVKMSYQFPNKQTKYIPVSESMCDIQGEMLLNFMSYDASHVEEQARKIILSIAVFPGKVFRLYLYIYFFPILGWERP